MAVQTGSKESKVLRVQKKYHHPKETSKPTGGSIKYPDVLFRMSVRLLAFATRIEWKPAFIITGAQNILIWDHYYLKAWS